MVAGGLRRFAALFALALAALAGLSFTASAAAERSVRVGPDYFGVNYPLMAVDSPTVRDRQLAAIRAAGFENVRAPLSWARLEPFRPDTGVPAYDWHSSDQQVGELARHALRMVPTFMYTPGWASVDPFRCGLSQQATAGTAKIAEYAQAAAALAARYGPGGSFWAQHPELPVMPVITWQIWNEPNLRSFWCPKPDPVAYAELFARAATAIKSIDPNARVITAGLIMSERPTEFVPVDQFLGRALIARPDLWRLADGAGAHIFPGGKVGDQFVLVARLREQMTMAGVPRTEPMYGTEIGWGLEGFGLTEAERAERYLYFTERLPSTNCNFGSMLAQSWTTSPPGGPFHDNDTGIADRNTGALFPSAVAFRDTVEVLRGGGPREAIHPKLEHCAGMPILDRDGDGVPEHRDYYPLDGSRWQGPPDWYGRLTLKAKRRQQLGRPLRASARCENACTLEARGKLRLEGLKRRRELKPDTGKAKAGGTADLLLRLDRATRKRIKGSNAKRGKAWIKVISTDLDDNMLESKVRVRLRRR